MQYITQNKIGTLGRRQKPTNLLAEAFNFYVNLMKYITQNRHIELIII